MYGCGNTVIDTARKLGYSIGGRLGEMSFEALELALASCLFPKKFSNMPTLRAKQHILLYWRKGFLKSTFLREFTKTIPKKFKVVNLAAFTNETLIGSVHRSKTSDQARIVPPILAGAQIGVTFEHSLLLRHGGPMGAKVAILNDVLEGDLVSNHLIKLSQISIDEQQREDLTKLGISLNTSSGMLSYQPDIAIFSASHPFDAKTLSFLVDSGHFDRFRVVQAKITREIAKECFSTELKLDKTAQEQLKKHNEAISSVKIEAIETPPPTRMEPLRELIFKAAEIPDLRLLGDMIRTLAGHMVLRHYSEDKLKTNYLQADYSEEDFDYVAYRLKDFVEPRLHPLMANEFAKIGKGRVRDTVKRHIVAFLSNSMLEGNGEEPLSDIKSYVFSKIPDIHFQTLNNGVKELLQEGVVERVEGKHGFYRLSDEKGENN
jgi:hypothetical protein